LFGFTVLTPHKSESSIFFCVHIFSQTGKASSTLLATSALINGFFAFGDIVGVSAFTICFLGSCAIDFTKGAVFVVGSVCGVSHSVTTLGLSGKTEEISFPPIAGLIGVALSIVEAKEVIDFFAVSISCSAFCDNFTVVGFFAYSRSVFLVPNDRLSNNFAILLLNVGLDSSLPACLHKKAQARNFIYVVGSEKSKLPCVHSVHHIVPCITYCFSSFATCFVSTQCSIDLAIATSLFISLRLILPCVASVTASSISFFILFLIGSAAFASNVSAGSQDFL